MASGKRKPTPRAPKPPPQRPPDPPTQQKLADHLHLSTRQVRNHLDVGMPATLDGAALWYAKYKIDELAKRGPKPKTQGKIREQELKNRLLELEIAEKTGQSIHRDVVRLQLRAVTLRASGAMRTLLQYNADLLGITAAAEMQIALERILNRMLAIARGDDPEEVESPGPAKEDAA